MKYARPKADPAKTLAIILIGACIMLFVDLFLLGGKDIIFRAAGNVTLSDREVTQLREQHRQYMDKGLKLVPSVKTDKKPLPDETMLASVSPGKYEEPALPDELPFPYEEFYEGGEMPVDSIIPMAGDIGEEGSDEITYTDPYFKTEINYDRQEEGVTAKETDQSVDKPTEQAKAALLKPPAQDSAASREVHKQAAATQTKDKAESVLAGMPVSPIKKGTVVIIIDDMGVSSNSRDVENLPGPLTLAYLPYADNLPAHAAYARKRGHELMVHMPMEPLNSHVDGGPTLLKVDQDREQFMEFLRYNLSRFEGFVGVNNHMGSRLTQNRPTMDRVMAELRRRGLYFVDSKTIGNSVAAQAAADAGLAYAERDIFLDHEINMTFIRNALRNVELTARHKGYAIAIGHPHDETIQALAAWLPTLKEKGLTLKPASAVVHRKPASVIMVSAPPELKAQKGPQQEIKLKTSEMSEDSNAAENGDQDEERRGFVVTEQGIILLPENSRPPVQPHE
ncbi:MAG: divergent polysaccharide deacetylase family protein [Alphaproteobacteria bacterium]|nr:divergent polysaccharide deacetylase family protein [Alphaproteobacteria bacterium]